jgi:hypothetical protein
MCVTSGPAKLSNTIIYAAEVINPDGKTRHVLGYQNAAENLNGGPNAMLLPIPSAQDLTEKNCISAVGFPNVLKRYAQYVTPRSRGMYLGTPSAPKGVQVFDSGSYTVVLAEDPTEILGALNKVPVEKRPTISPELLSFYKKHYHGFHVALCCFSGSVEAEPMLWEYTPLFRDTLFVPGVDAHNGSAPVQSIVDRDHTIILGVPSSSLHPEAAWRSSPLLDGVPAESRWLFTTSFTGKVVGGILGGQPNGDWEFPLRELRRRPDLFPSLEGNTVWPGPQKQA